MRPLAITTVAHAWRAPKRIRADKQRERVRNTDGHSVSSFRGRHRHDLAEGRCPRLTGECFPQSLER